MTPGLANKICIPCAVRVCTNFPETLKHLPAEKAVLTGSPIREELFKGDKEKGLKFCGFDNSKPVILILDRRKSVTTLCSGMKRDTSGTFEEISGNTSLRKRKER